MTDVDFIDPFSAANALGFGRVEPAIQFIKMAREMGRTVRTAVYDGRAGFSRGDIEALIALDGGSLSGGVRYGATIQHSRSVPIQP